MAPPSAHGEIISQFVINKSSGFTSVSLISFFNFFIGSTFTLAAVILAPTFANIFASLLPTLPTPLIAI